jgi:glucose-6-phosphate 1-epimerase
MSPFNLPASVSQTWLDSARLMPGLQIRNAHCEALLSLQGAQLLSFRAKGEKPLLWLSEQAVYVPGKAIRGGIPLCFPWFGPHAEDALKPAHGFARQQEWTLQEAHDHADHTTLVFRLGDDAASRALWPHAFLARLTLLLGSSLSLTLQVENTGDSPFRFSFALHSYFPVTDIRQTRVEGLEATDFIDQLKGDAVCKAENAAIRFSAETDRVYEGAGGHYRVVDEAGGDSLRIDAPSCRSAIVWNPWVEKTQRLADMADDAWCRMLCVECGNTGHDTVELAAGQQAGFSLALSRP